MSSLKSGLWALLTCVVALATVCALVLPEEDGARDNFVRLTRSGVQRQCFTGAACHEINDSDTRVETPGRTDLAVARHDSLQAPAVLPSLTRVAPPGGFSVEIKPVSAVPPTSHHGIAPSDRAPPAL